MTPDVQTITIVTGALVFTGLVGSSVWALVHFKLKNKELEAQEGGAKLGSGSRGAA